MQRFIGSMLVALLLGIGLGVYLGWVQFPVEQQNTPMCQLSEAYLEEYTLMVARGYHAGLTEINQTEARAAAMNRLLPLSTTSSPACAGAGTNIENVPAWVQEVTERNITRSASLRDICDLARLSAAFGRRIPGYADRPGTVCDQPR